MSYSFTVVGDNKADAKSKVAAEMDKVVSQQETHAADKDQAIAAANAFIDILADVTDKKVRVSVNGSLLWSGEKKFTNANVGVSAYLSD